MHTDDPTDPDEIALRQRYGPDWRRIIGSGMRDRGNRYDRNMRFNHGVPSGFLTRPVSPQSFTPATAIDTGVYEKYKQEYDRLLAEYNRYTNMINQYYQSYDPNSDYERQQQYYEDNWNNMYAQALAQNSSQSSQYNPGQNISGTITSSTGEQGLNMQPNLPASYSAPPAPPSVGQQLMLNNDRGGDRISVAASAPASAPNMVRPSAPASAPAYTAPAANTVLAPLMNQYSKNVQDGKVKSKSPAAPKAPAKQYKPVKAI